MRFPCGDMLRMRLRGLAGPPPWAFLARGLRALVLGLLAERPMNGAEVIRAVEEVTWGFWRPSPGSVYPLLRRLEEEGLAARGEDGRYRLTEAGMAEARRLPWPWRRWDSLAEAVEDLESISQYLEDLARTEPDRLAPYRERIRQAARRLSGI